MLIDKARIPKGSSFVLRSSAMEEALRAGAIVTEVHLHHVGPGIFFDAWFWPPRPNVPLERFFVRAGCVPSHQARQAREYVESRVLPDFILWASQILALPSNSPVRRSNQTFFRGFPVDEAAPGS